jgi:hypothetical protein
MSKKNRWERKRITCKETGLETNLLIEWLDEKGTEILNGVSCDNPQLQGIDNQDCKWSCWEGISKDES